MNEYNRNMRVEKNVIENKERNIGCAEQRTAEQKAHNVLQWHYGYNSTEIITILEIYVNCEYFMS